MYVAVETQLVADCTDGASEQSRVGKSIQGKWRFNFIEEMGWRSSFTTYSATK